MGFAKKILTFIEILMKIITFDKNLMLSKKNTYKAIA